MKTIGIVGGISWESSAEYYRQLNQAVKARLGPTHSAELVMYSMDFHRAARLEREERWPELATLLIHAVTRLEKAGVDLALLASNTAHMVAEIVRGSIHVPLLHIAEVAAREVERAGISKVGLLGNASLWSRNSIGKTFTPTG